MLPADWLLGLTSPAPSCPALLSVPTTDDFIHCFLLFLSSAHPLRPLTSRPNSVCVCVSVCFSQKLKRIFKHSSPPPFLILFTSFTSLSSSCFCFFLPLFTPLFLFFTSFSTPQSPLFSPPKKTLYNLRLGLYSVVVVMSRGCEEGVFV